MNAEVGRRMFIGSVAAGMPLLAGGAVMAQSERAQDDHTHGHGDAPDAVLEAGLQHLGKVTRSAKARGGPLTLEEAVSSAAYLRMFAARIRDLDLDAAAQRALHDRLAASGRDALLYEKPDRARVRQHLAPYGIEIDDRLIGMPDRTDYATRAAALEWALATPVSSAFERVAVALDATAVVLRKVGPGVQHVQDADWLAGYCSQLKNDMFHLSMVAQATCGSIFGGLFAETVCIGLYGSLAVLSSAYLYECGASSFFYY